MWGDGSAIPTLGRGKYVDIIRKGDIVDVISHSNHDLIADTLRIIPCRYNHGFFIERWVNNKLCGRAILSNIDLREFVVGGKH